MNILRDGWSWSEIGFADWRHAIDLRLDEVYAIAIEDAGLDDECLKSHWNDEEPPFEFVRWFGDKYDLEPRKPVWLHPDQTVAPHR